MNTHNPLLIIHAYPNTQHKINVLIESINSVSNIGYHILLVSHYPIPLDIQSMVTYYLFDSVNDLVHKNQSHIFYELYNSDHYVQIRDDLHNTAVLRNMYKSISFAKILGYDYFLFMDGDCIISVEDVVLFNQLTDNLVSNEYPMLFFNHGSLYATLLFGGNCEYFLNSIKIPYEVEDYNNSEYSPYILEVSFYMNYCNNSDTFLIINESVEDYFKHSKINVISRTSLMCEFVSYTTNQVVLHISQNSQLPHMVSIKVNGNTYNELQFLNGWWWYEIFNLNGDSIEIDIYEDGILVSTKKYKLDMELFDKFKENGFFKIITP
jgi:hypothetical protein